MVSKNCPITGEHVGIIFVTQYVTMATLACVAGGISRASAFVVVHEWRSRERIGEESS